MTCIVGLIDKGVLWMGADSMGSNGYTKNISQQPKLFFSKDSPNIIIGSSGSFRQLQLLRYMNIFNELDIAKSVTFDHEFMVKNFIPNLQTVFENGGIEENISGVKQSGYFLIGSKDGLFKIQCDYSVMQNANHYEACGSGEEVAKGSLFTTMNTDIPPKERIIKALEASEHHSCGVGRPFVIINTETKEIEIIK